MGEPVAAQVPQERLPEQLSAPESPLSTGSPETPSPRKASEANHTECTFSPPRTVGVGRDLPLQTFTAFVAKAFRHTNQSHLSKVDLFGHVCKSHGECTPATFEAHLGQLDRLNKVAVIDDLVFSLA